MRIGIGVDIVGRNYRAGGASAYTFTNAEAEAWVAAFSTPPSNAVKALHDDFVGGLKTDGLWSLTDVLWFLGAHTSQAVTINAKNPGVSNTLVASGAPTHTPYIGTAFDGVDDYFDTFYNPSTFGGQMTTNSAHLGLRSLTTGGVAGIAVGCRVANGSDQFMLHPRAVSDVASMRLNTDANLFIPASTDGSGHFIGRRSGASASALRRNTASLGTNTEASDVKPNLKVFIGAVNQNGSAANFVAMSFNMVHIGASLNDTQSDAFVGRADTFVNGMAALA